jgi:hypothetical protein
VSELTDGYLLTAAQIAATLIGLLVVGLYYFLETGLGRFSKPVRDILLPHIRAMSKLILLLFAFALAISLGLVALSPGWMRFLFIIVAIYFVPAAARFTRTGLAVRRTFSGNREILITTIITWVWLALIVSLPWVLGGWTPDRSQYGWSLLLAGFLAFAQTLGMFLMSFDLRQMAEE